MAAVISTLLLLLLAIATPPTRAASPLFTGDGVRSLTDAARDASWTSEPPVSIDDAALQQVLARALQDEQPDAMYVLAMLKFYGQRVDRDVAGAVRLLTRLAQRHGHRDAQFTLGVLFTGGGLEELPRDDRRGAAWLAASAASGHVDAKWVLAALYTEGRGVPRDPARALALLTDAVARGDQDAVEPHPRALFLLGVMHEYGHGGAPRDAARAAQLYQRASDRRDHDATYYLALLHAAGRGVRKNSALALRLLSVAADAGHAAALLRLGELHADGESGVGVDYAAALRFFQRAAASASSDQSHVHALAQRRAEELQWVLAQAEARVRDQERALGVPLLRVQVATIDGGD